MHPLQHLIELTRWTASNYVHNLGFIPADKLYWKAWPEAASAGEMTVHVCSVMHGMTQAFESGIYEWGTPPGWEPVITIESGQELVRRVAEEYVVFLEKLCAADLEGHVLLEDIPIARTRGALMPVLDLMHHHGQLAYIQTLLGDTQSHFFEMGT